MKRYSFVIEPILFLAIIIAFSFLIGSPGFIEYDLHPFYFVILVITMRYGYGKGAYSMLFSCGLYVLFFRLEKGHMDFHVLWENYYHSISFIAFWMFVGLLVDIDKKKIERLIEKDRYQRKVLHEKVLEINKLNKINENISNELIRSDSSFNILYEKTKNLFNENIGALYNAAYEILIKSIQATEAYILYIEGDRIEIVLSTTTQTNQRYLEAHKNEVEEVRKSKKFMRLDMLDRGTITSQTPVFMGPIIHQQTDTLYGLIIVQEIDFLNYNKNTFRTFVNLCKWLGELFYFRTKQNMTIAPIKGGRDFDFLVEYGASRSKIRSIVEKIFQ